MRGLIVVLMLNVSLGCNFDFLGDYLVVTALYLVVTGGYCLLPGGYCSLLVVPARYCSLVVVPTFSMNDLSLLLLDWNNRNVFFQTRYPPQK